MNFFNTRFLTSTLVLTLFAGIAAIPQTWAAEVPSTDPQKGTDLKPGQYRCTPSTTPRSRGECAYRPLPNGTSSLNTLVQLAVDHVKPIPMTQAPGSAPDAAPTPRKFTANDKEPVATSGLIVWWFETDEGKPDDAANDDMGRYISSHDYGTTIQEMPQIEISAEMHAFTETEGRELGVEVGSFLGKRTLEEKPPELLQSITSGIFKLAAGIGNPYASFLDIGITATAHKEISWEKKGWTSTAQIGQTLNINWTSQNYHDSITSSQPVIEPIGFRLTTVPEIDTRQPGLVLLKSLSVTYSTPTGDTAAPVLTYAVKSGNDTTLYTDQVLVLASQYSEGSTSSKKLVDSASSRENKKTLILVKVRLIPPRLARGEPNPYVGYGSYQKLQDSRALTPEELAQLPEELPLERILGSIERRCVRDIVNPENNEQVCGFAFREIDRAHKDYQLRFKIKKGGFLGIGGNTLFDESKRTQYLKLSDLYVEKGFYALPALALQKGSDSYTLEITLDKSGPVGKARRSRESVRGIKVPFGYKKGQVEPVEFEPALIKFIGKKGK